MKQLKNKRFVSVICMVLIVAMALSMTACSNTSTDTGTTGQDQMDVVEKTFMFEVVDGDGNFDSFKIVTDKQTVGEALLEEGLIAGEEGQYGLYVTEVNGIVADYNVDGTYWAFYVDGGYASTGVDMTDVVDGATYSFKVEQ